MRARLALAALILLAGAALALLLQPADPRPHVTRGGVPTTSTATSSDTTTAADVTTATSALASTPASSTEALAPRPGFARISGVVTLDGALLADVPVRWRSLDGAPDVSTRTDARGAFVVAVPARAWTTWEVVVEQSRIAKPGVTAWWKRRAGSVSPDEGGAQLFVVLLGPGEPPAWRGHASPSGPSCSASIQAERADDSALDIGLASRRPLGGRVVDADSGQGIADATVGVGYAFGEPDDVTRTGAEGAFHLETGPWAWHEIRSIARHVRASAEGYSPCTLSLADVARPEAVVLELRRPLRLEGRVVDEHGRPLAARVRVATNLTPARGPRSWTGPAPVDGGPANWWVEVACEEDGRFVVGVPPGSSDSDSGAVDPFAAPVSIGATFAGREVGRRQVTVRADTPPQVLILTRSVRLEGTVLGPDGGPLSGATVLPLPMDGGWFLRNRFGPDREGRLTRTSSREEKVTDARGRFELPRVSTRSLLLVEGPGLAPRLLELFLPLEADLVIRMEPSAGAIEGVVLFHGKPAKGMQVEAYGHGQPDRWKASITPGLEGPGVASVDLILAGTVDAAVTDEAGRFRLSSLVPGRYDLWLEGTYETPKDGVAPGARDVRLVVERPRGAQVTFRPLAAEDGAALGTGRAWWLDADAGEPWTVWRPHDAPPEGERAMLTWTPTLGRRLAVLAPGRRPAVLTLALEPSGVVELGPVRLESGGGRIALDVAWPAFAGARVRVRWRDPALGVWLSWDLDPPSVGRARFELDPVGAGRVELDVSVDVRPPRSLAVTVRDGETSIADVDLRE